MSDTPTRPLFPPRDTNTNMPPPSLGGPGVSSPSPAPPPAPPPPVNADIAAQIERTVVEIFGRRFGATAMPYNQARVLVSLEMELVGELVRTLAKTSAPA